MDVDIGSVWDTGDGFAWACPTCQRASDERWAEADPARAALREHVRRAHPELVAA